MKNPHFASPFEYKYYAKMQHPPCPRCKHISKNNRHRKSFVCECCGFALHADLIGARNIESRARTVRYNLEVQGCSQPPIRELSMDRGPSPGL
jgi:putative transposase-like DNA-binding protein